MFGYISLDKTTIEKGADNLFQAFMCGLCMSCKAQFGNTSRMAISNDINFFNVLFHSVIGSNVEVATSRCISHPFKGQPMVTRDVVTDKVAVAHVILTHLNLYDDVLDGTDIIKGVAYNAFKGNYAKACKLNGTLAETLGNRYDALRKLEKDNCNVLDVVCEEFSRMSVDFCKSILGEHSNPTVETLCYNIGKWVYLIDALDDVDKDLKKKQYNPFVATYNATNSSFVRENIDEITYIIYAVLNRVAQSYNDLNLTNYKCVLDNVIFHGIRNKTKDVLNKYVKE